MKDQHDTMQALPSQLYNCGQIRELERLAIEVVGISGYELMTRAGQAVFSLLISRFPEARKIAVICGAGNNAGDGFVVAKLALFAGLKVELICLADPTKLAGTAQQAYLSYKQAAGNEIIFSADLSINADVIVDALFGTGLTRAVSGDYAEAIAMINNLHAAKIAVDIPSGLHADSGKVMACAVKADITLTFIGLKQGLFTGDAPEYCGEICYADLSVPEQILSQVPSNVHLVKPESMPKRFRTAHKGSYGHVLIVGGDLGYSGAVRLAAEAALRVGAGLVSIATRKEQAVFMNISRPELMCRGIENQSQLGALVEQASVIVLGPGMGASEWSEWVFHTAIRTEKPLVVDADGLNFLAKSPQFNQNWVLTPHPGEAARLLGVSTSVIQAERFEKARALQNQYGGIVVLKGAGTLIASAEKIDVATTGNPGMASGGMGDVLAGVIGGLIAQHVGFESASRLGVYVHGAAADLAAAQGGERGLLASDLFPYLRQLVN